MDEYGTEKQFGRNSQNSQYYGESSHYRESIGKRVMDSFRRDPRMMLTPKGTLAGDGKVFDVETAAHNTANSPLQRKLKGRHLQMIAIGGSIGTFLCDHVCLLVMLIGRQVLVFSWVQAKPSPTVVRRVS